MTKRLLSVFMLAALALVTAPAGYPQAQIAPPEPSEPASSCDGAGPCQATDGDWFMPEGAQLDEQAMVMAAQETGGPDDFGYTWDDSVTMDWIDATEGTHTGLSHEDWGASVTGVIPLEFDFKFYENSYAGVYISSAGAVGFDRDSLAGEPGTGYVPFPEDPNNFVAPYLAPLRVNAGDYQGKVYYLRGGTEPNRYFVVEWHDVNDDQGGSFTFQVVLREEGDIAFQYLSMEHGSSPRCGTFAGIEDATGWDGLAYLQSSCNRMDEVSGKAVLFDRPDASARVNVHPSHQGRFTSAGDTEAFEVLIRNTGELGNDIYNVATSSTWPVAVYAADGVTPLSDTDGDGTVDTGGVAQGDSVTIVAEVTTPNGTNVGDANQAAVNVSSSVDTTKSKTVALRTSIPAPFAQVFRDNADGAMSLYLAQPRGHSLKKVTDDRYYGSHMAVAEIPDSFAYVWTKGRSTDNGYVREIEYTLLDSAGGTARGVSRLTDHSGATTNTYDYRPAAAAARNGRIGVLWYRRRYDSSTGNSNYNIFFAILDSSGDKVCGPVNVTDNDDWGGWGDEGVPRFYDPRIAATDDNRFVLAWHRDSQESAGSLTDIYYSVRDADGETIQGVTKFTDGVAGDDYYRDPALAALSGNRALLAYTGSDGLSYAVLDSAGGLVKGGTGAADWGWGPDAVQLSDEAILLGWTAWSGTRPTMNFAVLDGTTYDVAAEPSVLSHPAALTGDAYVSVTADGAGRGILTWTDSDYSYRHNLYYALVDGNGNVLTDPMVFRTSQATVPRIDTSLEGYGNTSYTKRFRVLLPMVTRSE